MTRPTSYGVLFGFLIVGFICSQQINYVGIAQVHTITEVVAVFIALFVSAMGFIRFISQKSSIFLFIGVGFLVTGLLDGYHAFVTSVFYIRRTSVVLPQQVLWSEIAPRIFLPIVWVLSWICWKSETKNGRFSVLIICLTLGFLAFVIFTVLLFVPLPNAIYSPKLFLSQPSALIPALFYLLALIVYWLKKDWQADNMDYTLGLSLIIGLGSEGLFMASSHQLFDSQFVAAHILKLSSYLAILIGLLMSMFIIFRQSEASIEDLSRAHAQLKARSRELSQTNSDLETLLYVISHDLKEPLRSIQNFSQMVSQRYAEKLDEKGRDFLVRVMRGAERLHQLLDDILILSKAKKLEVSQKVIAGEKVVKKALDRLEGTIKEKRAIIDISSDLPNLRVNETWATVAITNLISNALKYTFNGNVPEIHIGPYSGSEGTGIVVRDRGPGIPQEHRNRIFQLFQRAVGREIEGTGAGLAIVAQVAKRHGGRAWMRSRAGGGAEFIITFAP